MNEIDDKLNERKKRLFAVIVEVVKTYFRNDIETSTACAHAIVDRLLELKAKQK